MFKDIADAMREGFGTCLKEIKYLSERVEAVEKKVGITTKRKGTSSQNTTFPPKPTLEPGSESVNGMNAGRKSLAEDKAPEPSLVLLDKNQSTVSDLQKEDARYLEKKDAALALCRAKSDRTRKLAASQKSPYTTNRTARVVISNRKLYPGYNPFAPIDKNKLRELAEWLKSCPYYRTSLDKKPRKSRTWWYQILRTSLEWLEDCVNNLLHIDAWINVLRKRYNANPQHFRSERMCFLDHLFAQQWRFNFKDFKDSKPDQNGLGRRLPGGAHWIAIWISIPKRHIVVFDCICSSISPEDLNVRPTNIPPARAGDCGVYTLKYIECHALGIEFSKKYFAKANGKSMRDKMAVDIFQELPDAHEFVNKDMDDILGMYDG
ncbi:BnaCnng77990D [Brassica napus]|uniref:BnaCnng77990D protein n=1 Tax=Brassica napus TaxID=3708 RepID=A0A078K189_BRANA|nr:BnaCnng77990D [Brassica napus]